MFTDRPADAAVKSYVFKGSESQISFANAAGQRIARVLNYGDTIDLTDDEFAEVVAGRCALVINPVQAVPTSPKAVSAAASKVSTSASATSATAPSPKE